MALDSREFASGIEELVGAINGLRMAFTGETERELEEEEAYREESRRNRDALVGNTKATKENTDAKKLSTFVLNQLKNTAKALKDEFFNVGQAGIKLGSSLGTSATQGVQLELNNRAVLAKQLLNFNTDLAVTMEQLQATQTGFTDAFAGLREGTQISAEGSIGFASDLKKGFKSEFTPTAESFRILTQMGISTAGQMDAFRRGTGRASLSATQLSTLYNKNQLSFLLYGNSFGKAAVQAERLGINLASVQAAQEGLVTNLDGTIDTVAQLNQLGAQVDFGNLVRIAEQEGPDALMAYVRATVPENLMQSTSTRALFKQLGISVEDYLKSGQKQVSAADQLEQRMTEAASSTGGLANTIAGLTRVDQVLTGAFGELYNSVKKSTLALLDFITQLKAAGLTSLLKGLLPGGGAAAAGGAAAGAAPT